MRELHQLTEGRLPPRQVRDMALGTTFDAVMRGSSPTASGQVPCSTAANQGSWQTAAACGLATAAISLQTPTLLNLWTAAGSHQAPRYYKDGFGQVHIIGAVTGGTATATIFQLPAGYQPSAQRWCATFVYNGSTNVLAIVQIDTTGNVSMVQGAPANTNLNLECVFNT